MIKHLSSKDFIRCHRETVSEVAIVVSRHSVVHRKPLKIFNDPERVGDLINSAESNIPHSDKQDD